MLKSILKYEKIFLNLKAEIRSRKNKKAYNPAYKVLKNLMLEKTAISLQKLRNFRIFIKIDRKNAKYSFTCNNFQIECKAIKIISCYKLNE